MDSKHTQTQILEQTAQNQADRWDNQHTHASRHHRIVRNTKVRVYVGEDSEQSSKTSVAKTTLTHEVVDEAKDSSTRASSAATSATTEPPADKYSDSPAKHHHSHSHSCGTATHEQSTQHSEPHAHHHHDTASVVAAKDAQKLGESKSYRRLVMFAGFASVATALILILMKFIVWLISGSASILASLTDSLIDLCASLINLLALRYALTPADKDHRFGHYKAEALASLAQATFIAGSAGLLVINGYNRFVEPQDISYVDIAIYISIASIVLTLALTTFQAYVCKLTQSEAIAADRYHYLSDVGLNLSVIFSLALAKFGYDWADGLIAMFLGLYILKSALHLAQTAIHTLLDHSMSLEDNNKIMQAILSVDGIDSFHDLKTRKAGPQHYIQCHIVLAPTMPLIQAHLLADQAEHNIREHYPDADITIHMEPEIEATYKDITFVDQLYCEVPKDHYIKCDVPDTLYRKIKAAEAAEAAEVAEAKQATS